MSSKAEILARRNGAMIEELPLPPVAVMDGGEAAGTNGVSATPPEPRLAPHIVLADAVNALDIARYEARQCRPAVLASREAFNLALNAWNATLPIQTVEGLKKEWIRSNQAERERKAAVGQLRGPTTVGQMAKALAGGGHRAQRGGGTAYRRGAHSKAEAMELNAAKLRESRMNGSAAPRTKLPSER
jgi:hypothetical protein